jgi:hypothetical protein
MTPDAVRFGVFRLGRSRMINTDLAANFLTAFWILGIMVWSRIRILGSEHMITDPDPDPAPDPAPDLFDGDFQDANINNYIPNFLLITFTSVFKDNVPLKSHQTAKIKVLNFFAS